ncbi:hypothetical protein N665_0184s0015 [Sinapis alba]|nr:hypothetical protein N665_0184s0015 [Sinapis alba]
MAFYLPLIEDKLSLLLKESCLWIWRFSSSIPGEEWLCLDLFRRLRETANKIKENSYVCKGFVQVIQVWAYAYIPCLGEAIGHPIRSNGPCLLRFKGKGGKLPLGAILEKEKVTCMCPRSIDEVHPVWEDQDEDPKIDNILEFLCQDNSLSTITWQALLRYPLTPIESNKRRLVASQRKSKKSKKVASNRQENIADGGDKCADIAETEEQERSDDDGHFIIQRRKTPRHEMNTARILFQLLSEEVKILEKQFNSEAVSAFFQSASAITIDNLASRITQLEKIMQVKTPAHGRFSNTELPEKLATPTKTEGNTGETTVQGIDRHQDPRKEGDKEEVKEEVKEEGKQEGKLFREGHPDNPKKENAREDKLPFEDEGIAVGENASQTTRQYRPDNPVEENAGEDMEEELHFVGEGIDVGESAPHTVWEDHTDNPEEENAEEEADEEQGNEQSQSKSKEPDYEKAITVSSESLNPHPFARMEKKDKREATSSASVTTVVPSEDLAIKVAERKTSHLQYQANHSPPRYERNRIPALSQNLRSPFEPGNEVKEVLNRYAKGFHLSIWVTDERQYILRRISEAEGVVGKRGIAIMDVAFQILWTHQYANWKANSVLPGTSTQLFRLVGSKHLVVPLGREQALGCSVGKKL